MTTIDQLKENVVEAAKEWAEDTLRSDHETTWALDLWDAVKALEHDLILEDLAEDTPTPQDERPHRSIRADEVTREHELYDANGEVGLAGVFHPVYATQRDNDGDIEFILDDGSNGWGWLSPALLVIVRDKPPTPKTALERIEELAGYVDNWLLSKEEAGDCDKAWEIGKAQLRVWRQVLDILKEREA